MARRVRENSHARCRVGEKLEMTSKTYLSLFIAIMTMVITADTKEDLDINTDNLEQIARKGLCQQEY